MNKDLRFLDGLRAIAALWVVTAHCFIWGAGPAWLIPNAKLAVDLFMMLSGFLMVHSVESQRSMHRWRDFYVRRLSRIAPAYYVALAAVLLVPWFWPGYAVLYHLPRPAPMAWWYDTRSFYLSVPSLLAHATFIFGLIPSQTDATMLPDWSLSLEMQFYLAFPLIYLALKRFGYVPFTAFVLGACVLAHVAAKLAGGPYGGQPFPEPSTLPGKLPYFLIGMLMYQFAADNSPSNQSRVYLLACCALLSGVEARTYGKQVIFDLLSVGAFWVFLSDELAGFAVVSEARRLLGGALAKLGSNASYSVYLFHGFFISLCGEVLFSRPEFLALPLAVKLAVMWGIVASLSYAFAALIYRYVERPGIRLGAAIIGARKIAPIRTSAA